MGSFEATEEKKVPKEIYPAQHSEPSVIHYIIKAWKKMNLPVQISIMVLITIIIVATLALLLSTVNLMWLREQQITEATDFMIDSIDR